MQTHGNFIEIFRLSFRVFACAFPPEISSIFGNSFPFPFPYFVLFVLWYFPFHVNCTNTISRTLNIINVARIEILQTNDMQIKSVSW